MIQAGAIMEKKCLQSYRSLILHSLQITLTLFFILLALLVVNAWQGMKDLPALVAELGVNKCHGRRLVQIIVLTINTFSELLGTNQHSHVVHKQH